MSRLPSYSRWEISTSGGGGATSIGDLTDVDLTGIVASDVLEWDGSDFIPAKKLNSVSSNNTYLLNVDNTNVIQPVLQPNIGSNQPFLYVFGSPSVNGSQISANGSIVGDLTQISLGWTPLNRNYTDAEYVRHFYDLLMNHYPFYIRIVKADDVSEYATFQILSLAGTSGYSYNYNVLSVPPQTTTINTWANGTRLLVLIERAQPVTSTVSTTTNGMSVVNVGSNYEVNAHLNRNIIHNGDCFVHSLCYSGQILPTSVTPSLISSVDIVWPTMRTVEGDLNGWNQLQTYIPRNNITISRYSGATTLSFAVQLVGNWSAVVDIWVGFICKSHQIEIWGTSDFVVGHNLVYDTAAGSPNRGVWGRFGDNLFQHNSPGGYTNGSRTGTNTSNHVAYGNDILVATLDGHADFALRWYQSNGTLMSTGLGSPYGNAQNWNRMFTEGIVPVCSQSTKGAGRTIRILSQRDLEAAGIVLSGTQHCFY
jgi:hypothetical protein